MHDVSTSVSSIWRSRACMPVLAMLLAVLLASMPADSTAATPDGQRLHLTMTGHGHGCCEVQVEPTTSEGLAIGDVPAPRAGRLRVRECDRLGPSRLHLPPPTR